MDPLSLTASIIAVLQITSTLISYTINVKNASKEVTNLTVEAANILALLTKLRVRIEAVQNDDQWFQEVRELGVKGGVLHQLRSILEQIVVKLNSSTNKLSRITKPLSWAFNKKDVDEALQRIERLKSTIGLALQDDHFKLSLAIHSNIGDIISVQVDSKLKERQKEITSWLDPPDVSLNYHEALRKRQPGTGAWYMHSNVYAHWQRHPSFVLLYGKAGCGKTVISSTIIERVLSLFREDPSSTVAYFYFDFNDAEKKNSSAMLRSLISQLAPQTDGGLETLEQLYLKCDSGKVSPRDASLVRLLEDIIDEGQQTFIVIDALDECQNIEDALLCLRNLLEKYPDLLHLTLTSRAETDILVDLNPYSLCAIDMQAAIVDGDIKLYIENRLQTDVRLKRWPADVHTEIQTELMRKSDGMFRWVHCQLEALRTCIRLSTLRDILMSLPTSLNETYERILISIEHQGAFEDAFRILRWLCYTKEPLRITQLVEVLAITVGQEGSFLLDERLPNPLDITSICSCLIEGNLTHHAGGKLKFGNISSFDHGDEVRLAHYSVAEYLKSDRSRFSLRFRADLAEAEMAESCLLYLLYVCSNVCFDSQHQVLTDYPLTEYAGRYWWRHGTSMKDQPISDHIHGLIVDLLTSNSENLPMILQMSLSSSYDCYHKVQGKKVNPVYWASKFGFCDVVRVLLQKGYDVNKLDEIEPDHSAISMAAEGGFQDIVATLLDSGATAVTPALKKAAIAGHVNVLRILLKHGTYEYLPLFDAAWEGHVEVVQLLLDAGAILGGYEGQDSPLYTAALKGHLEVVRLLLAKGADLQGDNPVIIQACTRNHIEVVRILLEHGVDGNHYYPQRNMDKGLPIVAAAAAGNKGVVEVLIRYGNIDVNRQDPYHGTALQQACLSYEPGIVELLLNAGANPNISGGDWRLGSPLSAAIFEAEDEKMVKMLIKAGANPDQQEANRRTLLSQAVTLSSERHVITSDSEKPIRTLRSERYIQTLLNIDANVNLIDDLMGTALQQACSVGKYDIAAILIDRGADPDLCGGNLGTPLWEAMSGRHERLEKMLLAKGASAIKARPKHDDREIDEEEDEGLLVFVKKR